MSENEFMLRDFFDEELEPVEDETDLEVLFKTEFSHSTIQATDWTVSTLIDQVERGRVQLTPRFQRRDAWVNLNKSRFIESLMLGFPVPQLVLAELPKKKGRYIVIDGKQRLLSILQFAGANYENQAFDPLKLSGLTILENLNGKTIRDLTNEKRNVAALEEFENRTIRTLVVRNWENDAVLYHIFLRLNTGSVQLSPQELRNALHPGPFANFVDEYSGESPALRKILKTERPDFRMRDAELLLRYLAFRNFLPAYAGSMKVFLDTTTKKFNDDWGFEAGAIEAQVHDFENAVNSTFEIFGERDAFRKWKGKGFVGSFNRAVFDIMLYYFSDPEIRFRALEKPERLKDEYIALSKTNQDFLSSLESTTKSLGATFARFSIWTTVLNKVLRAKLPVPSLEDNRIQF